MIQLKSPQEIERMRAPAQMDAEVLAIVRENCVDGVSTYDLDRIAEEETLKRGGKPTFKGYRGFPASLCTSINQEVVHGIPSKKRILKSGDILGIDFRSDLRWFHRRPCHDRADRRGFRRDRAAASDHGGISL